MTMKLKLRFNLGDDWPRDKDGNYYKEGQLVDFDEATAAKLLKASLAEESGKLATGAPSMQLEAESPVAADNAQDAIVAIANMRSKEKLQSIVDNDDRETVREAAKRRLTKI